VLIRSVERREKERAMHERFARRIEAGLGQSPRTIFDEPAGFRAPTVVLPTEDGRELRLCPLAAHREPPRQPLHLQHGRVYKLVPFFGRECACRDGPSSVTTVF
jgi:hypothetical protein